MASRILSVDELCVIGKRASIMRKKYTIKQIAAALEVSHITVSKYLKIFEKGGTKAIRQHVKQRQHKSEITRQANMEKARLKALEIKKAQTEKVLSKTQQKAAKLNAQYNKKYKELVNERKKDLICQKWIA